MRIAGRHWMPAATVTSRSPSDCRISRVRSKHVSAPERTSSSPYYSLLSSRVVQNARCKMDNLTPPARVETLDDVATVERRLVELLLAIQQVDTDATKLCAPIL